MSLHITDEVVWQETGARFAGGSSIVARHLQFDGLPDPAWSDSGRVLTSSTTVDRLEDVQPGTILWSDSRAATVARGKLGAVPKFSIQCGVPRVQTSPGKPTPGVKAMRRVMVSNSRASSAAFSSRVNSSL